MNYRDERKSLRFTFDPEADASYLYLTNEGTAASQTVIDTDRGIVILDHDKHGRILGIEILGATAMLPEEWELTQQ
ncbi:DUF2283 domain-containing protein [Corynebacterium felinum]|uniref:Uncharacterized protein YuzE n=1 Tax=Corynebacterium felinum TaxID=131318 RepID=A0ABU2B5X6_9CORY|nr:DUF2283 domain-containing protein [Corynebacterium felinum]MDF5821503.1 DUF2283 domain-containing protein [Corynebacterium felinum]MDR7354022.1 uncharacterized protein YuzE [Corynebacterium felinum]WJY96196.1 hypothetical protein CFELI_13085 [Corynebacterium felinum]